jgi:hypothetical protein
VRRHLPGRSHRSALPDRPRAARTICMTTAPVLNIRDFYDRQAALYEVMNDWPSRLSFELPFISMHWAISRQAVLDVAWRRAPRHHIGPSCYRQRRGHQRRNARPGTAKRSPRRRVCSFEQSSFADLGACRQALTRCCVWATRSPRLDRSGTVGSAHRNARPAADGGVLILQNLNYDLRWKNPALSRSIRPRWTTAQCSSGAWRTITTPGPRVPGAGRDLP